VWHLAAAALGPDEAVATALDGTARRARARAAHATAAAAALRAAELSSSPAARARRLHAAGEAAWLSGNPARALRVLDEALALAPERRLRAEIEHLRGQATIRCGDVMSGHAMLVDAASRIEPHDPGKAVEMLAEAADACAYAGRPRRMLSVSRRAWNLLSPDAGSRERFFAGVAFGTALVYNGAGAAGARQLRRAVGILEREGSLAGDPGALAATTLGPLWLRGSQTTTALIDRTIESVRAGGELGQLPLTLALAGREAATSDRWARAAVFYEEAADLARRTGQDMPLCAALGGLAGLEARQGREQPCRAHAREAMRLAEQRGLVYLELWALDALAELELGLGRPRDARAQLERKLRILERLAITDPDISPVPELVETAVRAGVPDPVAGARAAFARHSLQKAQPWALARWQRCLGLLAGGDELEHHFSRALDLHFRTRDRFETARTHLCYGECLRRTGRRVRARQELRLALETFDALGAAPWAHRARAELQASGEAARRRDPSTLDDLTPQELRVGTLLASGATTREAATELFLSPKTVEYHQRNAYRKLGVHSREALATRLGVTPAAR
jgi:DNA-binding CsgD family transcriptional regulator